MKRHILFLSICLFLNPVLYAAYPSGNRDSIAVNDGPYVTYRNDTLKVLRIESSLVREEYLLPGDRSEIVISRNQSSDYLEMMKVFSNKPDYRHSYKRVDSIAVLSDAHGQYDIFLNQLMANGIIDRNLNWKFGRGHLVYLGDAHDRGEMVTEILWHLFSLEKQAAKAGGMVHFVIGNHELMVLDGDLRFINPKYRKVEALTGKTYSDLYSENTVLGKWLRNKPVMITINDIIFVHGGISPDLVRRNLNIRQINQIFADSITGRDIWSGEVNERLDFLAGNDGPSWYRGYFTNPDFTESRLDSILLFYDKAHIVVGHTTHKELQVVFNNKVFGIDAGIMYGQPGVMLIYKEGCFYKGTISGKREKL